MKKVIINENQKGFLFHNGRFVKLLGAGKYPLFGAREIEIVSLKEPLISAKCELDTLLRKQRGRQTDLCLRSCGPAAGASLHKRKIRDGVLRRGKYAFWSVLERHEYQLGYLHARGCGGCAAVHIRKASHHGLYKVEVAQYQKARLYFDQKLIRILDAGTYYFWKNNIRVDVNLVDAAHPDGGQGAGRSG